MHDAETNPEKLPKDRGSPNRHIRINSNRGERNNKNRKRYGAKRGNYISYKQTRLRPVTIPQGGDSYFNDIREPPKKSCRIFFQNLGGYPMDSTRRIMELQAVKKFEADYIGLQETKINEANRKAATITTKQFLKYLSANTRLKSNTDSFSSSHWQPGGLASLTMKSLQQKGNKEWADPTALIMRTRIERKGTKLSILNIYLPKANPGPTSSYTQALNTIRRTKGWETANGVEEYFYDKLAECIKDDLKKGYRPVVGGDFNDTHSLRSTMTTKMEAMGLLNATSPPDMETPTTYKRGKRTIDHIWIVPELSPLVTGFGYLPYDLGFTSDHRGVFIDILREKWEQTKRPGKRRRKLNSKNPDSVSRYLKKLWKKVDNQDIEKRLARLEGKEHLTKGEERELNKIDMEMTTGMLNAEAALQQCRSQDFSSDAMTRAKRVRHYWRRILRLSPTDNHFSLRHYFPLHKEENILKSQKEIRTKLNEASLEIVKIRANGAKEREEMLNEKARHEARRRGDEEPAPNGIRTMINAERSKRRHAELRKFKHPKTMEAKEIEIPAETRDIDKIWRILKEERREIEEIQWEKIYGEKETTDFLLRWCVRHFGQAANTPLNNGNWRNTLDPRKAENIVKEILEGRMRVPDGCPPELEQFMRAAKKPEGITDIRFTMTFEHFKRFCTKQDERKESSPSGLHYGHLRALLYDERLLRIKYKIIETAYTHGIILTRWKTLWEVLIPKKRRSYIHKFRNITLVEGDIQYLMKALWSRALMRAVSPILHPSQNALQGRVTQSGVLSHRIALDTMFVRGEECIIVENDAVNCFDRILPIIAALALMRLGMTPGMVRFYLNFLERAEHHILLSNKPSREKYAHSQNTPIMGSGQGTGWAGPSWFAVSDILFTSLAQNQPGIYLVSPDGETEDFRTAEASIDDARQVVNTGGVNKFNREQGTSLTLEQAATRACQGFERYLTLTGGRLALDKTMFYALKPDMRGTRKCYLGGSDLEVKMELDENFDGTKTSLKMYQPDEAHKMLGIFTDPAGTLRDQVIYMKTQAAEWNKRMIGSTLGSDAKWLSYKTELRPKLIYPLPAVSLSRAECEIIIHPAIVSIKHGLGIPKTTPHKTIFFPREYGGYGVVDIHLEKLVEQTKYVVQHLRNGDSLGKRILICIGTSQMESGLNTPIERNGTLSKLNYITPTILTDLINELWELKAELWFHHWTPERGRTIMGTIRKEARDSEQMNEINICRLWLRVHYIKDIATMDGKKIHPGYLKGERVRGSKWTWPRWKPPRRTLNIWRNCIRSYITNKLPTTENPAAHQYAEAWIDRENTEVSTKEGVFNITQEGRRRVLGRCTSTKHTYIPCDIIKQGGRTELIATREVTPAEPRTEEPVTFLGSLIQKEPQLREVFEALPSETEDHMAIADLISAQELVAGSDGGDDQNGRIVFAITLTSEDLTEVHTSSHEIIGGPKDSGRAEMMGIMTTVIYLCHILEWYRMPNDTKITIYCDNRETVDFSNQLWLGTTPRWADTRNIELKRTIRKYLMGQGRGLRIRHVKGHQDRGAAPEMLDLPAKINVMCDEGCTRRLETEYQINQETESRDPLQTEVASLKVDGIPVTNGFRGALYKKKYAGAVTEHLGLTDDTFNEIDWDGHARAVNETGGPSLRRIIWDHHPTRSHLKTTGQYPTNMCPLCGEADTRDHFLQCREINQSRQYRKIRDELRHLANGSGFPDHLINTIATIMEGKTIEIEKMPLHARYIYRKQENIGWRHMIKGRISHRWGEVRTVDSNGRKDTERRWRTKAIKLILRWTHEKWVLRCTLYQDPEKDLELQELYEACSEWWTARDIKGLLQTDAYLRNPKQAPRTKQSKDFLREWMRTREIAEEAYRRYRPDETQPTLHRWLVHKTR